MASGSPICPRPGSAWRSARSSPPPASVSPRAALGRPALAFVVPLALLATLYGVRTIARNPSGARPCRSSPPWSRTRRARDARTPRARHRARGRRARRRSACRVRARARDQAEDGTTLYNFRERAPNGRAASTRRSRALQADGRRAPRFPRGLEEPRQHRDLRGNYPEALTWLTAPRRLAPTDARLGDEQSPTRIS